MAVAWSGNRAGLPRRQGFAHRRPVPALWIAMLGVVLLGASDALAAGAVSLELWDGAVTHEAITSVGDSATRTNAIGDPSAMANNVSLNGSAWAHLGGWWSFQISGVPQVTIRVDAANAAEFTPGLSVWAIGHASFDGGTTSYASETSTAGFGTPHSFNAYESLGNSGTLWMQQGQGGNAKETLGYANAGASYLGTTGWGETITTGAHDVSASNSYVTRVSGSTGSGFAELVLHNPTPGWYLVYVGGTDPAQAGGFFDLTAEGVAEVPGLSLPALALLALVLTGVGVWLRPRFSQAAP